MDDADSSESDNPQKRHRQPVGEQLPQHPQTRPQGLPQPQDTDKGATAHDAGDANDDANDDANEQQPSHASLLTIGEACLHLICEYLRGYILFPHKYLSLLSRTCRTLYIAVRNLPSILENPRPSFMLREKPHSMRWADISYWSDLAGFIWQVNNPPDINTMRIVPAHDVEKTRLSLNDEALEIITPEIVGRIFVSFSERFARKMFCRSDYRVFEDLVAHCGGIEYRYTNSMGFGFYTDRCKKLRMLRLGAGTNQFSLQAVSDLLRQQEHLQYCCIFANALDLPSLETSALSLVNELQLYGSHCVTDMSTFCVNQQRQSSALQSTSVPLPHLPSHMPPQRRLSNLRFLTLYRCTNIKEISNLSDMLTLSLSSCPAITSISNITRVRAIEAYHCLGLRSVANIQHADDFGLKSCVNVEAVTNVSGVEKMAVYVCPSLAKIDKVRSMDAVVLHDCPLSDASPLSNIANVELSACKSLRDVSPLKHVHTLTLRCCPNVTDVSTLATVNTLSLLMCKNITNAETLTGHVDQLTIE